MENKQESWNIMRDPNQIINDSKKATIFGTFYEQIVRSWLENIEKYHIFEGKPRVYWKTIRIDTEDTSLFTKNIKLKLQKILDQNRSYCIPYGFLTKDEKYYIWEAKNWPFWKENKLPLEQLRDVLSELPQIFADQVNYRKKTYNDIAGFVFSWWDRLDDIEDLIESIERITGKKFKIYFTSEILKDCIKNQYAWYIEIIKEEQERSKDLFKGLLGN